MTALNSIQPVTIRHLNVPLTEDDGSIILGSPIPNPDMKDPDEKRFCLASFVPEIRDIDTIRLKPEDGCYAQSNDPAGASKLYTLLAQMGKDLYGGSGVNKGNFYTLNWKDHPFQTAGDAVGYLSLLMTPFCTRDGLPEAYSGNILVLSDEDYESQTKLPAGYGIILSDAVEGQARILIDNQSIGKGLCVPRSFFEGIGISYPEEWQEYDLIMCASDIKVNAPKPGVYNCQFGITNISTHTIHGQAISLGFEFWQFIKPDSTLNNQLVNQILTQRLPEYRNMILTLENRRKLAAYLNNQEYDPLELNQKLEEALLILGPEYPWVSRQLERTISNYLLHKPFQGTEFRLIVVVQDSVYGQIQSRYKTSKSVIVGKYPITSGLLTLPNTCQIGPYLVLSKTQADLINADSDGDCGFICDPNRNPLFQTIIDRNLIKPIRDIDIPEKEKYQLSLTTENLAKTMWRIYLTSNHIGALTIGYFLSEMSNEIFDTNIDLSTFYRGIERVIKSSKHRMDTSFLNKLDWDTLKNLKELLSMPYLRAEKKGLTKQINTARVDDIKTLLKVQIEEPLHYTDYLWNATLSRINIEIDRLRANTKPAGDWADQIGLSIIPKDLEPHLNREIKQIQGLINIWVGIGKGTIDSKQGIEAITTASKTFSTIAKREALRAYLTRTNSRGGFLVHLGYGQLAEIFGNKLRYTMKDKPGHLMRFWTNDNIVADFKIVEDFNIDSGIPHINGTVFIPEDGVENYLDNRKVIQAIPYLSKTGQFTKSLWAILN